MRKMSLLMIIVCFIVLSPTNAQAGDSFHPSRTRLLFFGKEKLTDQLELRADFIPAGNLLGEVAPLAYLGLGYLPSEHLDLTASAGWAFKPDEPIASIRIAPSFGRFWAWSEVDWNRPSNDSYYFLQAQIKVADVIHVGAETEGWGNWLDDGWSHGAGPNTLLRFGKRVGFDLALHFRNQEQETKPEFVTRFLLWL